MKAIYGIVAALALGGCADHNAENTAPSEAKFSVLTMTCTDESGATLQVKMYAKTETVTLDGKTYHFVEPTGEQINYAKMTFSNSAEGTLYFDMGKPGYTSLLKVKGGQQKVFKCQNVKQKSPPTGRANRV
ncbi:hypothetical protein RM345_000462 [Enterobacter cloacae]|nr:hypothetical protein [Enterobacter cloacae]ELV2769819.1 hypothetical protein [Enterobacter cloacae]ELV2779054.1 hypothetical protein [Enterobacter cloacae]